MIFYVIWKPISDFLLVINSNLGPTLHLLVAIARNGIQGHARSIISI